ncbi:MAG: hypothetical protein AB2693_23280 [Candidatus Thiodiazotropha sp.]
MKNDNVSRIAKSDPTILAFGEKLCNKHGQDEDKHNYIRQKMREMARLLQELRKSTQSQDHKLASFFHPKYFRCIVACSKSISQFDETSNRYGTPSLALKIGHSLQKCVKIAIGDYIEARDRHSEEAAQDLQKLIDLNWTDEVSINALKTIQEEKRKKGNTILPLAEDVKQLSDHLKTKAATEYKMLQSTDDEAMFVKSWTSLNEIVLAQLILFNRRRSGEASKMKVSDYQNRHTANENSQFDKILSDFEKKLCKAMPRVEILGKRDRPVPVLFPSNISRSIDVLLLHRDRVVDHNNKYLFPTVHYGALSHIRGSDCMRKFANECGAKEPDRLRSTKLRKHIATMSQVLNLQDNELDILARFMGHDIRVHREFYRLPEATVQVAKVSKLLLQMEDGGTGLVPGERLEDVQLDDNDIIEGKN